MVIKNIIKYKKDLKIQPVIISKTYNDKKA